MQELLERDLSSATLVILDTETTGLEPALGHRVIEVAAVRVEGWREVDRLQQLVNPGRPIDPGASRVNGIFDEDVAGAPPFAAIAADLQHLAAGAVLVAHNAPFDAAFLALEYRLLDEGEGGSAAALLNPWLCTLQLARRAFYFRRNSLGHVARALGVRTGRAHRALNDVYTTLQILKRMAHELAQRQVTTVGDLLHLQGGPILAPPAVRPALPPVLADAVARQALLHIRYRSGSQETERVITPLYATEMQGNHYLVAFCHLRQAQRTFRVDRILRAEKHP